MVPDVMATNTDLILWRANDDVIYELIVVFAICFQKRLDGILLGYSEL